VLVFLREWVQEIVILLILATFIDMALPNSAIKRYVDYTVGLILLLLLLTPIIGLLDNELDVNAMLASAEQHSSKTLVTTQPISDKSSWLAYKLLLEDRIKQMLSETKRVTSSTVAVIIDQNPASIDFGNPIIIEVHAKLIKTNTEVVDNEVFITELSDKIQTTYGLERTKVRIYIE